MNMNRKIDGRPLDGSILESRYSPSVMTAVPAIGNGL